MKRRTMALSSADAPPQPSPAAVAAADNASCQVCMPTFSPVCSSAQLHVDHKVCSRWNMVKLITGRRVAANVHARARQKEGSGTAASAADEPGPLASAMSNGALRPPARSSSHDREPAMILFDEDVDPPLPGPAGRGAPAGGKCAE